MSKALLFLILLAFTKYCSAQTFTYDAQSKLTSIDYTDGKRIEYSYDKLGNRISEKVISPYCNTRLTGFGTEGASGISYQWQVNTGSGFANITDGTFYFGAAQDSLIVKNPPTNYAFNKYRCVITTTGGIVFSDTYQFRIKATWQGSADTAWENPANWECSLVPDQYVDVTIPSGRANYPSVNSTNAVNSLKLENGSVVIIKPTVVLDVKSRQE
jgi:YD repeat-containing protein